MSPVIDPDIAWRAVHSRDPRFDGLFLLAVTTTGIYCRPSCPARTPHRQNTRFYRSAEAAQLAGFRACLRCQPDATPDAPEWDLHRDLAQRALRFIESGFLNDNSVEALAELFGYSVRQLTRVLTDVFGTGPQALARSHRAHTARALLGNTTLPVTQIAFASGFASVRSFNETLQSVYGRTPSQLRGSHTEELSAVRHTLTLRLTHRGPLAWDVLMRYFASHAIAGVEEVLGSVYRRTVTLAHGPALIELEPLTARERQIRVTLQLSSLADLSAAVSTARHLCDLDADVEAVEEVLTELVHTPGVRIPGAASMWEAVLRAVAGQQVSVAAAAGTLSRMSERIGSSIRHSDAFLTHTLPSPEEVLGAYEKDPTLLGLPRRRGATLAEIATRTLDGSLILEPATPTEELREKLFAIRGVGPWTVASVLMHGAGASDEMLANDLGIKRAAELLGLPSAPRALSEHAEKWRPYRSYAALHMWEHQRKGQL